MTKINIIRIIRLLLIGFIIMLVVSGITAFPIEWELSLFDGVISRLSADHELFAWLAYVSRGVSETYSKYPFIAYGTDWLAFAHIVIAIAFAGPLLDPVKNRWVIRFGMIACVLVIPLALTAGHYREIPVLWRLLDCSFGVIGIIPLWYCDKLIEKLEIMQTSKHTQQ